MTTLRPTANPEDYALRWPITEADIELAYKIVQVHASEQWPARVVCRNCRETYPCRLRRWGQTVLTLSRGTARWLEVSQRPQPAGSPTKG